MFQTPQFVTGPFQPQRVFLEDREYGLALDALVKGCSDVLVVSSDKTRVLLGRRKVEPQPDWWFIGGRSRPGDTTAAAAARNVKRELGLEFEEARFEVVANYSMVWSYRQQAPTSNGTADLSTIHALFLTQQEETEGVPALDPKEYHESQWWTIAEVLGDEKRFHPLLRNSLQALESKIAFEKLEAAVQEDEPLESIVKQAKALVQATQAAKISESSIKVIFDSESNQYIRVGEDYRPLTEGKEKRQKLGERDRFSA